MYHYVRPVAGSTFPRLKALEYTDFLGQLDHLQAHYDMISPSDLADALARGTPLPKRPCLLTFDDGYADHYRYAFPALKARGLAGLFFAPKSSCIDRDMLEVNRIQFVLANHPAPDTLADELDTMLVPDGRFNPVDLRKAFFAPNRYDSASIAYTKRLLQHGLPAELRTDLTRALFRLYVDDDEKSFANDLYLTPEQAHDMLSGGMAFGGHGDLHLWHDQTSPEQLAREVAGSAAAMNAIGAPVNGGAYCYPFGGQNDAVRDAVRAAGFSIGFTVVPALWSPSADHLQISRLDTNDLPHKPDPQCPWLAQVADQEAR
jgi:peptidoglycan/xylan/chitin deacetylase (PgdA/CDA1 family)